MYCFAETVEEGYMCCRVVMEVVDRTRWTAEEEGSMLVAAVVVHQREEAHIGVSLINMSVTV